MHYKNTFNNLKTLIGIFRRRINQVLVLQKKLRKSVLKPISHISLLKQLEETWRLKVLACLLVLLLHLEYNRSSYFKLTLTTKKKGSKKMSN